MGTNDIGFRFEEIQSLVDAAKFDAICRSKSMIDTYLAWRDEICKKYRSVVEYVKITVMGCESAVDEKGDGKHFAIAPPKDGLIILRPNDFPYNIIDGEHYVLWFTGVDKLEDEVIERELKSVLPGYEYVYFINPPYRQTIPEAC